MFITVILRNLTDSFLHNQARITGIHYDFIQQVGMGCHPYRQFSRSFFLYRDMTIGIADMRNFQFARRFRLFDLQSKFSFCIRHCTDITSIYGYIHILQSFFILLILHLTNDGKIISGISLRPYRRAAKHQTYCQPSNHVLF